MLQKFQESLMYLFFPNRNEGLFLHQNVTNCLKLRNGDVRYALSVMVWRVLSGSLTVSAVLPKGILMTYCFFFVVFSLLGDQIWQYN